MITLTENAITAVGRFISSSEKPTAGLRIAVTDGGCSGLQYGLKLEETQKEDDTGCRLWRCKTIYRCRKFSYAG